jgi:hypothetical protein
MTTSPAFEMPVAPTKFGKTKRLWTTLSSVVTVTGGPRDQRTATFGMSAKVRVVAEPTTNRPSALISTADDATGPPATSPRWTMPVALSQTKALMAVVAALSPTT